VEIDGETRGVAPGRALDGRETRGSQPPGDVPGRPVAVAPPVRGPSPAGGPSGVALGPPPAIRAWP